MGDRVTVPRRCVRQRGPRDCGVAALATALGVSYARAFRALRITMAPRTLRQGTKTRDLVAAVELLGYRAPWPRLRPTGPRGWSAVPAPQVGPLYVVKVPHEAVRGWHWVVKLRDGRGWDPDWGVFDAEAAPRVTSYLAFRPR